MKKLLTFVLVLAMVLSVSSVALAYIGDATADNGVASITSGGTTYYYLTLEKAVDEAQNGDTITLLKSSDGNGIVIDKSLTIDFATYTYTVSGALVGSGAKYRTSGFQILKEAGSVVLKNGTLTASETAYKPAYSEGGVDYPDSTPCRRLIQDYASLTLTNMTLDSSKCSNQYGIVFNGGTVTIKDTDIIAPAITDGVAFAVSKYASYDAPTVTVEGDSNIDGNIDVGPDSSASGAGVPTLTIKSGVVDGEIIKDTTNGVANIAITGGEFSDPDAANYTAPDAFVATVGGTTAVGQDSVDEAVKANPGKDVVVKQGSGNLTVPAGTKVTVESTTSGTTPAPGTSAPSVTVNGKPVSEGQSYTVPFPAECGPGIWYEGGNTFSTDTSSVPVVVEIDGVPVSFTTNGNKITVDCINPGASKITVRWSYTSVTTPFRPDASISCTTVSIPKTGDMSIWAAIAAFLGF